MCLQSKIWKERLLCLMKYNLAPPSLPLEGDLSKREGHFNKPLWPYPLRKIHAPHWLPSWAQPLQLRRSLSHCGQKGSSQLPLSIADLRLKIFSKTSSKNKTGYKGTTKFYPSCMSQDAVGHRALTTTNLTAVSCSKSQVPRGGGTPFPQSCVWMGPQQLPHFPDGVWPKHKSHNSIFLF